MDRSHLAPLMCVCPWLFPGRETFPLTLFLPSRTFSPLVLHNTRPAPWFLFPPPRFLLMAQRGELWCQLTCTSTGTAPVPLHLFQGWGHGRAETFLPPRRRTPQHHCDLVRIQSWTACQRKPTQNAAYANANPSAYQPSENGRERRPLGEREELRKTINRATGMEYCA